MKEINQKDVKRLIRLSWVLTVLAIVMLLAPIPLAKFLGWWGLAVYGVIIAVTMTVAVAIEKRKKAYNISTYKELEAFFAGKRLDEIESIKEEAKRPYQTLVGVLVSAAAGLAASALMFWILG